MVVNETINATIAADTISQNPSLFSGAKDGFFFIPNMIRDFIFSIPGYRLGWIIGVLILLVLAIGLCSWLFGNNTGD